MTGRDMRWWLIAACLAAIVAVNGALALVLSREVSQALVRREAAVAQEFLTGILTAEQSGEKLFDLPSPSPALTSFALHVRSIPGIIRANIYSPDGFIRHSTEANLIGLQFKDNEELAEAFAGQVVAKIEEFSERDKAEHLGLGRLSGEAVIEAYIPVKAADGQVAAVVEFYRDATQVTAAARLVKRTIWQAAAASGAILFLTLAAVVMLGRRKGN